MISTIDPTRNTTDRFFIDSNVLVYSYDSADLDKRSVAQQLIADLVGKRNGFISVQVLGEFFVSLTRRIQNRSLSRRQPRLLTCLARYL